MLRSREIDRRRRRTDPRDASRLGRCLLVVVLSPFLLLADESSRDETSSNGTGTNEAGTNEAVGDGSAGSQETGAADASSDDAARGDGTTDRSAPDQNASDEATAEQRTPRSGAPVEEGPERVRHARRVVVPLPIAGSVDLVVRERIERALEDMPAEQPRPVLVLEFRSPDGEPAVSSQFERSLSLARFLAGDSLNRVRTVAYLPASVQGHAVLPVIACEEIVMHPDAEFGAAGIQEEFVDQTMRSGYVEIAGRRRTIPTPLVLGMLDREVAVYRIGTLDGNRFVLEDELKRLEQEGKVGVQKTVVPADDFGVFTGTQLRLEYALVSHLVRDANDVVTQLRLPPGSMSDLLADGEWKAVLVEINGPVNSKNVSWVISSIEQQCADGEVNFICVRIDSPGGAPEESIRLAQWLAEQQERRIRTVAFVPRQARADAALITAGCDDLAIGPDARLGGPGAVVLDDSRAEAFVPALEAIARSKQRNWSLHAGLVDANLEIFRFTRNGGNSVRFLCQREWESLDDREQWVRDAKVGLEGGIRGQEALDMRLAGLLASSMDEVQNHFGLRERPVSVERNWAHSLIERLASPALARTLLFFAFFSLMIELMNPGLSVAGFLSGLCFLLFFWSQFLHGTAGWLEVLLFVAGATCVVLEIFVLPGVGVFGIGGCVLIISSIVLASQTFVIPRNEYQLEQLPVSLSAVLAAGAGTIVSIVLMRRFLPHTPFFRNMMLTPPDEKSLAEIDDRERMAHFEYLTGKRGTTTTQLTPSGKARFGDDVVNVISSGDLIPRGTAVYVVETRGNHVIVDRLDT